MGRFANHNQVLATDSVRPLKADDARLRKRVLRKQGVGGVKQCGNNKLAKQDPAARGQMDEVLTAAGYDCDGKDAKITVRRRQGLLATAPNPPK